MPATVLAREAIDSWLRHQWRKARHAAIADYTSEMGGTDFDLESAAIEHLAKTGVQLGIGTLPTRRRPA